MLIGPRPLSQIPIPVPADNIELTTLPQFAELAKYIKDVPSAIALGKALFWDMQVGSDGKVACATCHFQAGADGRLSGTLHPGTGNNFGKNGLNIPMSPSYTLQPGDFPFFQVSPLDGSLGIDPVTGVAGGQVTKNIGNVVVGSQGVIKTDFVSIGTGTAVDNGTQVLDTVFNLDNNNPPFTAGTTTANNLRQVTGRNAPSVINAVFNNANFWDGRANNTFNGVSPFGPADQSARIWVNNNGTLTQQKVAIPNASLASQAVGPPLNPVEMSYNGRTFPELGRKMINNNLIPLGQQLVAPNDSVFSNVNGQNFTRNIPGLNTTYASMIQNAFNANLTTNTLLPDGSGFTQIEANFSFFWGLSIMFYESTLVSDNTPLDRFQGGNQNALSLDAQKGFNTFTSKCAICHSGSEFSNAVIGSDLPNCVLPDCNPITILQNTLITAGQTNMETLLQVPTVISDNGFFNVGVSLTTDDIGRGGTAPFTNTSAIPPAPFPLSFSRLAKLQDQGQLPFATPVLLPGTTFSTPDAVDGSFKTAGLRNVELTPPYFHTGSIFTLADVIHFYVRGGNFPFNAPGGNQEQAINVQPLGRLRGNQTGQDQIVTFLKSLTDDRVRQGQTPFDHPELFIPDGTSPDIHLPATGGPPTPVPITTFSMNPVISPTLATLQTISGAVVDGTPLNDSVVVAVTVGNTAGTIISAATVTGLIWTFDVLSMQVGSNSISVTANTATGAISTLPTATIVVLPIATLAGTPQNTTKFNSINITVGGAGVAKYQYSLDNSPFTGDIPVTTNISLGNLPDGIHTIAVLGSDASGQFRQPPDKATNFTWLVKSTPPVLTLNPVTSIVRGAVTISGTVDLGIVPQIFVDKTATIGQVSIIGGSGIATWSCQISGLKNGTATITARATDVAFNQTQRSTNITVIVPDGAFSGTGVVDITDAIKALRFAVNLATPSADELLRGDVNLDGKIGVDDALLILKKVVGLINF